MRLRGMILPLTIACIFSFSNSIAQQCKDFGKKGCKKVELGDYKGNGQLTVTSLVPGEDAELAMVFYGQHDYKVILCAEEHLGDLELTILNANGDILFSNRDYDMIQDWDFSMTKTQRLNIKVKALRENATNPDVVEEGCVRLIIGNRSTPKSGFH